MDPTNLPSISSEGHHWACSLLTAFQLLLGQWLCHHICHILRCVNFLKLQMFLLKHVSYPMIPHINMLRLQMICWILCQVDGTFTVTVHNVAILFNTQLLYKVLHPQGFFATFSDCNILCFCGRQSNTLLKSGLPWNYSPCKDEQISW